jgi:uncharacterized protein (TIGR02186 family)
MKTGRAATAFRACMLALALHLVADDRHASAQTVATAAPEESKPEEIQIGISVDIIPVTSDFSGSSIAVFGSIENPDRLAQILNEYTIAVVVTGPPQDVAVRRKSRVFGIWVNRETRTYRNVPGFYSVASNREVPAIAGQAVLKERQIGIDNLSLNLLSRGGETFIQPAPEFAASLRRLRIDKELFQENPAGVAFLGSSLFRATVEIPSNIPIGRHVVTAYLFRKGEFLASRQASFRVEKIGFEEYLHSFANNHGLWYGVFAVLAALVTGWLANAAFSGRAR